MGWKQFVVQKNFGSQNIVGPKLFEVSNKFEILKIYCSKNLGSKIFLSKYFLSPKIWIPKQVGSKKIKKKILCPKIIFGSKQILGHKSKVQKN